MLIDYWNELVRNLAGPRQCSKRLLALFNTIEVSS
jgi:hypothetical protein